MDRRHFLVDRVGGFLAPIPEKGRNEISRRWPAVSLEWLDTEFGYYLHIRDAINSQPPASDIADRFAAIRADVGRTLEGLAWIKGNNLGSIVEQLCWFDDTSALAEALTALRRLAPALKMTEEKYLPKGHQLNPRHWLAKTVSEIVAAAGEPVDRRPNGAVCGIVSILLGAAGESVTNVVTIVKAVVKKTG